MPPTLLVSGLFNNSPFFYFLDNDFMPSDPTEFEGVLRPLDEHSVTMTGEVRDEFGDADVVAHFLEADGASCSYESAAYMVWWKTYRTGASEEAASTVCYIFTKEEGEGAQSAWKGCYATFPVENESTVNVTRCVLTAPSSS